MTSTDRQRRRRKTMAKTTVVMTGTDKGERGDVDTERDTKNGKAFAAQWACESSHSRISHTDEGEYEAAVAFYILRLLTQPGAGYLYVEHV